MRDAKGRFCKVDLSKNYRIGDNVQRFGPGGVVKHGTLGTVKNVWDSGIEVEWLGHGHEDYSVAFALEHIIQTGFSERKPATEPEPPMTGPSIVTNLDAKCGIGSMYFGQEGLKIKTCEGWKDAPTPEPTIAPGAVVRLKSGGPDMTVTAVDVAGMRGCTGYTYHHNGKIITGCSPTACLEVVR